MRETNFFVDRFYTFYKNQVGPQRLDEYFQLPELKLDFTRTNAFEFQLSFRHKRRFMPPNIECLPTDVLRYIASFLTHTRRIEMVVAHKNDYPFIPPRWELQSSTVARYKVAEAVFQHNYTYSVPGNWCMQGMVSDILQMLLRVLPILEDKVLE